MTAETEESSFLNNKITLENLLKQSSKINMSYSIGYKIAEEKHVPTKLRERPYSVKLKINFSISWLEERSKDDEIRDNWYASNSSSSDCIELCDADSLSLQAIGDSYQDHL